MRVCFHDVITPSFHTCNLYLIFLRSEHIEQLTPESIRSSAYVSLKGLSMMQNRVVRKLSFLLLTIIIITIIIIFFFSWSTSVNSSSPSASNSIKSNLRPLSYAHAHRLVTCPPHSPPLGRSNHSHRFPSLIPNSLSSNRCRYSHNKGHPSKFL